MQCTLVGALGITNQDIFCDHKEIMPMTVVELSWMSKTQKVGHLWHWHVPYVAKQNRQIPLIRFKDHHTKYMDKIASLDLIYWPIYRQYIVAKMISSSLSLLKQKLTYMYLAIVGYGSIGLQ